MQDQKVKDKIQYSLVDGLKIGLIDTITNMYTNNLTGEKLDLSEAFDHGFLI